MPELKNQHYVPKVHLRAFSDDEGPKPRRINLINVAKEKAIKSASLADQCSKDYFYGRNLDLERALNGIEGIYADCVRRVHAGSTSIHLLKSLQEFAYLQYLRTDAAKRRFKAVHDQMIDAIGDENWTPKATHDELVTEALTTYFSTKHLISDLYPLLIENKTQSEFVTSDAPAVIFNKWMAQKHSRSDFGISSSGLCIYMPLTPQFAIFCFDANVYRVDDTTNERLQLRRRSEVDLLNALIMRADAINIYFRDWDHREYLLSQAIKEKALRTPSSRTTILVPMEGHGERYRPLRDGEDAKQFQKSLVHTQSVFPRPPHWFGFLKNKLRAVFFEDGSAVGYVRKREWLSSEDLAPIASPATSHVKRDKPLPGLPGNPFS